MEQRLFFASASAFIIPSNFSEQQHKMSKYYVCCRHKELNSLSQHNCYLLALVADYDGVTPMSEMMMLVMMAIIITLTITAMAMSRKTLEAFFFRIFIVWLHKTDSLRPFLLPH